MCKKNIFIYFTKMSQMGKDVEGEKDLQKECVLVKGGEKVQLYHWHARSKNGRSYEGEYLADSVNEVAVFIRTNYGYVTGIKAVNLGKHWWGNFFCKKQVTDLERSRFFQQLSVMLTSGLVLSRALELLQCRVTDALGVACGELLKDLYNGKALALAMKKHPYIFPVLTTSVVEAGELSGNLPKLLLELAAYYEQQAKIKKFIQNIALYPMLILVLSSFTFIFFIIKILPLFAELYVSLGVQASLLISLFLNVKYLLTTYSLLWITVVVVMLSICWQKRNIIREKFWNLGICKMYRQMFLEIRFTRVLALLLDSGIALPVAISSAAATLGMPFLEEKAQRFSDAVRRGIDIAQAAAMVNPLFCDTSIEFVTVGSSTGRLSEMLLLAAELLEEDLFNKIRNAKVLLEPVLLLIVSILVSIVIFTVASPLFTLITEMPEYN